MVCYTSPVQTVECCANVRPIRISAASPYASCVDPAGRAFPYPPGLGGGPAGAAYRVLRRPPVVVGLGRCRVGWGRSTSRRAVVVEGRREGVAGKAIAGGSPEASVLRSPVRRSSRLVSHTRGGMASRAGHAHSLRAFGPARTPNPRRCSRESCLTSTCSIFRVRRDRAGPRCAPPSACSVGLPL